MLQQELAKILEIKTCSGKDGQQLCVLNMFALKGSNPAPSLWSQSKELNFNNYCHNQINDQLNTKFMKLEDE